MKIFLRITLWSSAIVLLAGVAYFQNRTPANDIQWVDSFDAARQQAERTGRPMMLYFTAEWCGPCQRMKRTVWPDEEVEQTVNARVVPVYIDVDGEMGQSLGYEYGVRSVPTFVFTDARGKPLQHRRDTNDDGEPDAFVELRVIGLQEKADLLNVVTIAGAPR